MSDKKIAIIGAGITGLVTAYILQQNGTETHVYERRAEPGGSIKTERKEDWQYEYGPNTLLLKDREVAGFLDRLQLKDDVVRANPAAAKRYIIRDGSPVPLPASLTGAVKTPLFSFGSKLRVLAEPFIGRSRDPDETLASFVERRLGREILDYAINPFVAGIFASNPENLAVRHAFPLLYNLEQDYGSLITGTILGRKKRQASGRTKRELISFKNGMQTLTDTLAGRLSQLHLESEVTEVLQSAEGWTLRANGKIKGPYTDVVVNVPLYRWGSDFLPIRDDLLGKLQKVTYQPLSVMIVGYKKRDIRHPLDGFGFLVPEVEQRSILGALFSSTLFPGRAPSDCHLLTVFIGGGRQPEAAALSSEELFKMVEKELFELIGLTGEPVIKDHIFWPKAIPSYHPGYDEILDTFDQIESEHPGLHLSGNFRGGVSVPDCIKNGMDLGGRLSV